MNVYFTCDIGLTLSLQIIQRKGVKCLLQNFEEMFPQSWYRFVIQKYSTDVVTILTCKSGLFRNFNISVCSTGETFHKDFKGVLKFWLVLVDSRSEIREGMFYSVITITRLQSVSLHSLPFLVHNVYPVYSFSKIK